MRGRASTCAGHRRATVAAFSALSLFGIAAGCTSIPTPSGRPEAAVAVEPHEVKQRLSQELTLNGWMVTAIDELGLTCSHPLSPFHREFAGHGDWICRFNLVPIEGGTSITVVCHVRSRWHDEDVSRDKQGLRMQELLERLFAGQLLHQPYLNPED